MNMRTLVVTTLWAIALVAGGYVARSLVTNGDLTTVQFIAAMLWGMFWVMVYITVSLWVDRRRSRKEARQNAEAVVHSGTIVRDIHEMEQVLLHLFCIVYTPDSSSIPDARYYPAWRSQLFSVNGGSPQVVRRLAQGNPPILPQLGEENPPRLTPIQRVAIRQVIDERRPAFSVR